MDQLVYGYTKRSAGRGWPFVDWMTWQKDKMESLMSTPSDRLYDHNPLADEESIKEDDRGSG